MTSLIAMDPDPGVQVADIESRAQRFETPCGEGSMVWHRWGEGPPLLLLHGSHGSWTHWIRNIDSFAAQRTVWVPDLPGQGDSASLPLDEHVEIAGALASGLRTLIGEDLPVDIGGFSFGGVVAAHLAAFHPELVRRLIIIGTGGLDTTMGDVRTARVKGLEGQEREDAMRANLLSIMLHRPDRVDALALHLQDSNVARCRIQPMWLVLPDRLLRILPDVAVPLAAIWGEHDSLHPPYAGQADALRRSHPDLEFHVIADSGHWVPFECPEAFNRTMLDLLERL